MNIHMAKLFNAQRALRSHPVKSPEWVAIIDSLRKSMPAPILAHFLRIVSNGGKGIAEVNQGVCSACHIRVPSSQAAILATRDDEVHVCEYCGSYLAMPEADTATPLNSGAPQHRERRSARTLVAASQS